MLFTDAQGNLHPYVPGSALKTTWIEFDFLRGGTIAYDRSAEEARINETFHPWPRSFKQFHNSQ